MHRIYTPYSRLEGYEGSTPSGSTNSTIYNRQMTFKRVKTLTRNPNDVKEALVCIFLTKLALNFIYITSFITIIAAFLSSQPIYFMSSVFVFLAFGIESYLKYLLDFYQFDVDNELEKLDL